MTSTAGLNPSSRTWADLPPLQTPLFNQAPPCAEEPTRAPRIGAVASTNRSGAPGCSIAESMALREMALRESGPPPQARQR